MKLLIFTRRLFPIPFLTVSVQYFPPSPSTSQREVTLGFITPDQKVSLLTSDQSSIRTLRLGLWQGDIHGLHPAPCALPVPMNCIQQPLSTSSC